MIGATVTYKSDPGKGAVSDFDGNYSIAIESDSAVTLVFRSIGLVQQEVDVNPKGGEVIIMNIELSDNTEVLKTFEVKAKARRSGDAYLSKLKVNSPTSIDVMGKELMKKTGDGTVDGAMKRITGVSTVGKYVSVRGLADRYLVTTINGSRIPTLDPFTNNIKLDIFPTGLIDNIIITKSAAPNLPGDWSGAFMSVNTADFPERLQVSVSTTFGYNTNATFNNIIASKESSTDWLGYDDGLRAIPDGVPQVFDNESDGFPARVTGVGLYDQMLLLGLGPFLNGYGVTPNTPFGNGGQLHLLSLVELGLLAPALFNDPIAQQNAIAAYATTYPVGPLIQQANADLEAIGLKFDHDNMFVTEKEAPIDFTQSFTIGNQIELFKKPLGFMFGFRYNRRHRYDPESVWQRTVLERDEPIDDSQPQNQDFEQRVGSITYSWNLLANASYKLSNNHRVGLRFIPNRIGINNARQFNGFDSELQQEGNPWGDDQYYEQRKQFVYQFNSDHYFPGLKLKAGVEASYTDGDQEVPDFRSVIYVFDEDRQLFNWPNTGNTPRRFRTLAEDVYDIRADFEFPLDTLSTLSRKLMFGGAYLHAQRASDQVQYDIFRQVSDDIITPNYFSDDKFIWREDGSVDLFYVNGSSIVFNDVGFKDIYAGYVMTDYELSQKLRAVAGVRVEYFDLVTDIKEFYENDIPLDDIETRTVSGGFFGIGDIEDASVLPSLNMVYKIRDTEEVTMNLRANAFLSVARPNFREASAVSLVDYELRATVTGNPDLETTQIRNYELRWENFFRKGTNISLSTFYKDFENHIELLFDGTNFTWQNAERSYALGIELEGRVLLPMNLEFRGNFSWIESETEVRFTNNISIDTLITRDMYGQAPYIINGILTYTADSLGLSASVSYNVQGNKLAIAAEADTDFPDVFEMSRHIVDVSVSKNFGKHWSVTARARNLLNAPVLRQYKFDSGFDVDFDRFTWGTDYSLGVSYSIR